MTKTTKKEYEEEKYKTIQRLKFEIKELKELNIDLQLRFKDTFSQSDLEQLRQELKSSEGYLQLDNTSKGLELINCDYCHKETCVYFTINLKNEFKYSHLCYHCYLDSVFAKYIKEE